MTNLNRDSGELVERLTRHADVLVGDLAFRSERHDHRLHRAAAVQHQRAQDFGLRELQPGAATIEAHNLVDQLNPVPFDGLLSMGVINRLSACLATIADLRMGAW
jgi:hypothetical protein